MKDQMTQKNTLANFSMYNIPMDPLYEEQLHWILPGHGKTVYIYAIVVSSEAMITERTVTASQTHISQPRLIDESVVIGTWIFSLIPIYDLILPTVPDELNIFQFK